MDKAILLAVAASVCTATASLCQRQGAKDNETAGFDARLIFRLARQPAWLLGIAAMIGGFMFQIIALRYGDLSLVQPILAAELLFVFGYLAIAGTRRVTGRDLLAAAAMSAGIGVFLRLAAPSGGRLHAPGSAWLLAGLVTVGVVAAALAVASGLGRRPGAPRSRRAAVLGAATGISWGFMAAVVKELSAHLGGGPGAVFSAWSLYLLLAAGAVTMLLASHALAAGPLAASQPGFTILDPLAASLLGVFLFGEHIRTGPVALAGEALALAVVVAGAAALSRSSLITAETASSSRPHQPAPSSIASAAPAARPRTDVRPPERLFELAADRPLVASPGEGIGVASCPMAGLIGVAANRMPAAEVEVSAVLVGRLLAAQHPDLARLPVEFLANGWDNELYRVGDGLVARLPRRALGAEIIKNEQRWLPGLAPRLPLPIPYPERTGVPGCGYPYSWSVVPYLPGVPAAQASSFDAAQAAAAVGGFLGALHVPAPADAPANRFRGVPLAERAGTFAANLALLTGQAGQAGQDQVGQDQAGQDRVDRDTVLRVWDAALAGPGYDGPPVWLHGDLHPANILVNDGQVSGVIDFGDITAGDPASDLSVAWMLLPTGYRASFWSAYAAVGADHGVGVGDALWARARGWALNLAIVLLAHSDDNAVLRQVGRRTLRAVLKDQVR